MHVLIPTQIDDYHALAVQLGLEQLGHSADRWFGTDFPQQQSASLDISNDQGFRWRAAGQHLSIGDRSYDAVWYRRPNAPVLPEWLHPKDVEFVHRENLEFYKSIWHSVETDAFWINTPGSYALSSNKVAQLRLAVDCGLKVPKSLISNDPARIRAFLDQHADVGAIYKPFRPGTWFKEDGGYARIPTTLLTSSELPDDDVLQSTPGIFQQKINKTFELRVTFFGAHYVAAKMTAKPGVNLVDWREANLEQMSLEHHQLPEDIYQKCRQLMKKLGIVFGCFDIIVDSSQNYVFLEVNEMGQFLFLEEVNRDFGLLDIFCQFIISKNPDFKYTGDVTSPALRLETVSAKSAFEQRAKQDEQDHIVRTGPPRGKL